MLLDMNKHLHDEAGTATDHANLGRLYAQHGKLREAREQWQQALALYEKTGETENAGVVKEWLSNLDREKSA
jgi:Tfp pilus assembly protein PilF